MKILFLVTLFFAMSAHAELGVSKDEILIGSINAVSGPAASLGQGANLGARALIEKINKSGGVHGRKIKVVVEDDAYEPSQTDDAAKKMIETTKVFALLNSVGAPTTKVLIPRLAKADLPLIGVVSGSEFLRVPVDRNVFNVRASYADESALILNELTDTHKIREIGLLVQDDAFGDSALAVIVRDLTKRGLRPQGIGRFPRNSDQITPALELIIKAQPKAVIIVGGAKGAGEFLRQSRARKFQPQFVSLSFIGTEAFIKEVGTDTENVWISQVMPSPESSQLAFVKHYRDDMKAIGQKELSYQSLEGYLNAAVLVEALKKAGSELTRAGLRAALDKLDQDFGGIKIKFAPEDHSGSKKVYLTHVKKGKAVLLGDR